jgi:oxepin-CoA hydrolase/3-oxo-5,6-dehydrosuberyl-CoA semialdehyde dehydrogenase
MSKVLKSWVRGEWHEGTGRRATLHDPTTEEPIAEAGTGGIDFAAVLDFARREGGPALRSASFAERGAMLARMASSIHARRDELLELARINGGNTRGDAKFDVDGATGTLSAYAKWAEGLGDARFLLDGEPVRLSRSPRYVGRHVLVPLTGAAVHVNAFNFPAWGFAEKAAVALLAGVPVVTKPATSTALVAERIVEVLVEDDVLPTGALQLLSGSPGDLLDHVRGQDCVAFTGSAKTGRTIRGTESVLTRSVRVNVEADSLNSAVLAPDVEPGSETFDLFVADVVRDMTQKAGQKCTAIRRVFVPEALLADAREALGTELSAMKVGNPALREVKVGPLATRSQLEDVRAGIDLLVREAEIVHGALGPGELVDLPAGRGWFQQPVLLLAPDADGAAAVHSHEVFGPVATLLPYSGEPEEAARLVALGQGCLVSSVYTDDRDWAARAFVGLAPWLGRLNVGSAKVAEHSLGPGAVLPQLVHGGPGRAGGGEELGALRGLSFYLQRTALQGDEPLLARVVSDGTLPTA